MASNVLVGRFRTIKKPGGVMNYIDKGLSILKQALNFKSVENSIYR